MRNLIRLAMGIAPLCLISAAVGASLAPDQPAARAQEVPCAGVVSLAELGHPVLPEGWTIRLDCGPSPNRMAGVTDPDARTITIWPTVHGELAAIQWTLWHETGHAWDHAVFTNKDRQAWRELRGLDGEPWWWVYDGEWDQQSWAASPGEDLAEAYAYCRVPHPELARIAGWKPPTQADCRVLDELVRLDDQ